MRFLPSGPSPPRHLPLATAHPTPPPGSVCGAKAVQPQYRYFLIACKTNTSAIDQASECGPSSAASPRVIGPRGSAARLPLPLTVPVCTPTAPPLLLTVQLPLLCCSGMHRLQDRLPRLRRGGYLVDEDGRHPL